MLFTLEIKCPFCETLHYVNVQGGDFENYCEGGLAQKCFPYLSSTEREQIISHICPDCQSKIF